MRRRPPWTVRVVDYVGQAWIALIAFVLVVALARTCVRDASGAPVAWDRSTMIAWCRTFQWAAYYDPERAVDDVRTVTNDPREQRLLLGWAYYESGWGHVVIGDCGGKPRTLANCKAFGPMQVHHPERWVPGATPAAVVVDRQLGYRAGLAVLRWALKQSGGDVQAALRIYSSGRADRAFAKVAGRCAVIGC